VVCVLLIEFKIILLFLMYTSLQVRFFSLSF